MTGRFIWQEDLGGLAVGAHVIKIPVYGLAGGVYICRLRVGNQERSVLFMVD